MVRNWPVTLTLILLGLLLVTWAVMIAVDPIDRLAIRLSLRSFNGPSLENGMFGTMNVPASANTEDLVRALYGPQESYQILEAKKIWIMEPTSSSKCLAALTDRDRGDPAHDKTICLFLYKNGSWRVGIYDPGE
jgi:hypothetical protein